MLLPGTVSRLGIFFAPLLVPTESDQRSEVRAAFPIGRPNVAVQVATRKDTVVPAEVAEPASRLVGDPARRDELRLTGGHVTYATGRHAFERTLPALANWIVAHSDELDPPLER